MRVALVGRIAACTGLLTLCSLGRLDPVACANEAREALSGPNVCPPAAYLATAPGAASNCPTCEQEAEREARQPRLFSRWRFFLRNREASAESTAPQSPRQIAGVNAACAADSRACAAECERTVNFEEPLDAAATRPPCAGQDAACACPAAECRACAGQVAQGDACACSADACDPCACQASECAACACADSECAACACPADHCTADACQDSECACVCHDAECAACTCPVAACAAGACAESGCAACAASDAACPACTGECGSACCEPSAEEAAAAPPAVALGEPSPDEMAAEILELMQRLGPGALDGTVFELPEGETADSAAAEAARAAMRAELESHLRWLAEEHLALQVVGATPENADQAFTVPVAPAEEVSDVTTLQRACRNLEETAQMLEEQRLFAAADQVRDVAAQLRQTARGLTGQSALRAATSGGTSVRSTRRPSAPGRTASAHQRPMTQTRRMSNLR